MIQILASYLLIFISLAVISASLTNFIVYIFNLDGNSPGAIFAKVGAIFTEYLGFVCQTCFSVWLSWFLLLGLWVLSDFYWKDSIIFYAQIAGIIFTFPAVAMYFLSLLMSDSNTVEK